MKLLHTFFQTPQKMTTFAQNIKLHRVPALMLSPYSYYSYYSQPILFS